MANARRRLRLGLVLASGLACRAAWEAPSADESLAAAACAGDDGEECSALSLRQLRSTRVHQQGRPAERLSAGGAGDPPITGSAIGPEDQEESAIRGGTFGEALKYKGAIFFGPVNPTADSIGAAYAGAELFEGTPACPMPSNKCPNVETAWVMAQFDVSKDEVPVLANIPGVDKKQFVLVDFNEPAKGPNPSFPNSSLPALVGADGMWTTPPVLGTVDHHAERLPGFGEFADKSVLLYGRHPSGFIIETHAYGATSTIFTRKFQVLNRVPSKKAAGLMLGGILSETQGLTTPSTTDYDKAAVVFLSKIAGVSDWGAFYEKQAVAKSSEALTAPLKQVFSSAITKSAVVPGDLELIIDTIDAANTEIYQGVLQKRPGEIAEALEQVRGSYEKESAKDGTAQVEKLLYVWLSDAKDKISTLLMQGEVEKCVALQALSKDLPGSPDVLTSKQECRPDAAVAQSVGNGVFFISSGQCTSLKLQMQPLLTAAALQYATGKLNCNVTAGSNSTQAGR